MNFVLHLLSPFLNTNTFLVFPSFRTASCCPWLRPGCFCLTVPHFSLFPFRLPICGCSHHSSLSGFRNRFRLHLALLLLLPQLLNYPVPNLLFQRWFQLPPELTDTLTCHLCQLLIPNSQMSRWCAWSPVEAYTRLVMPGFPRNVMVLIWSLIGILKNILNYKVIPFPCSYCFVILSKNSFAPQTSSLLYFYSYFYNFFFILFQSRLDFLLFIFFHLKKSFRNIIFKIILH